MFSICILKIRDTFLQFQEQIDRHLLTTEFLHLLLYGVDETASLKGKICQ